MAPEGVDDPAVVSSPDGPSMMLNNFASAMVRKLSSVATSRAARHVVFLPNSVRVGSACSGADVWHFAAKEIRGILSDMACSAHSIETAFVCEKNTMKHELLLNLPHVPSSS